MNYASLCARASNTPEGAALMDVHFDPVVLKLISILKRARPDLSDEDIFWGYHFVTRGLDEHARPAPRDRPPVGRSPPLRRLPGGQEAHRQVHGGRPWPWLSRGCIALRGAEGVLVPPDRIELSTSALPRMRSTTELRRRFRPPGRGKGGVLAKGRPGGKRNRLDGDSAGTVAHGRHGRNPAAPSPPNRPPATMQAPAPKAAREARLAAALRDNLWRRKAPPKGQT